MESQKPARTVEEAKKTLQESLDIYSSKIIPEQIALLCVVKAFEVLIEYLWKELKHKVEDEGVDAASPKEAIRQAARLNIIKDPELWIDCVTARNSSVHDYFSISTKDYIKLAKELINSSEQITPAKAGKKTLKAKHQ